MIDPADVFTVDQQEGEAMERLSNMVGHYMTLRRAGTTHTQALLALAIGLHTAVASQPLTISSILAVAVTRLGMDQLVREGFEI